MFRPYNSLADRLHDRAGISAAEAVPVADAAIRTLASQVSDEIQRALGVLQNERDLYQHSAGDRGFDMTRVYAGADVLAALATFTGRSHLGRAAYSLCKLIADNPDVRSDAVKVYIDALLLIHREDATGERLMTQLKALRRLDAVLMRGKD